MQQANLIPQVVDNEIDHKSYALILTNNKQDEPCLLIGADADNGHYLLPGGDIDYTLDASPRQAAINISGLQTAINLEQAEVVAEQEYKSSSIDNDERLHFLSFQLKKPAEQFFLKQKTPHYYLINRHRKYFYTESLHFLSFIKLSGIKIEIVPEINYPVCTYLGKPFPPFACPTIAKLCRYQEFDNPKTAALAHHLNFNSFKLLTNAAKAGDIPYLSTLLKLKLH